MVRTEPGEGALDALVDRGAQHLGLGSRARVGALVVALVVAHRGHEASASHLVDRGIGRDAVDPRSSRGIIGQGVELAVSLDKGVLRDVGRAIGVAHHAPHVVVDRLGELGKEALEARFACGIPGWRTHQGLRRHVPRPGHRLHVVLRTGGCCHSDLVRARRLTCYRLARRGFKRETDGAGCGAPRRRTRARQG